MELRDALKNLRSELGMTQTDLAAALRVNYATISRWEAGKTYPNRSLSASLLEFARSRGVSELCSKNLKEAVGTSVKAKLSRANGALYTVEHSSLSDLIEEASFPIYVCDIETDEILYLNKKASTLLGGNKTEYQGKKCYECIMKRDTTCPFCHKEELSDDRFTYRDMVNPETNTFHRIHGKRIRWNGRDAHIRYITDIEGRVSVTEHKEQEVAYQESLRVRKEIAASALVSAHFNLTKNTVSDVESSSDYWLRFVSGMWAAPNLCTKYRVSGGGIVKVSYTAYTML